MLVPVGFRPWEISALVNGEIVTRHAEEAAFLWEMRRRACGEPHYSLQDLRALDERVEANLQGLRVASERGWQACRANLDNISAGAVFALGVLAFSGTRREHMRDALFAACAEPRLQAGLISAFGWLPFETITPWLSLLLRSSEPQHRGVAIAAHAVHRRDPGAALSVAVNDLDPGLRLRALRAVGELKREDLAGMLLDHLRDDDGACRFWSAWSLTLLGACEGLAHLRRVVEAVGVHRYRALEVVVRGMQVDESRAWLSSLITRDIPPALIVMATGMVGDTVAAEWLIDRMSDPVLAKLAGEAFASMCGVDLEFNDLIRDPPDEYSDQEAVTIDAEVNVADGSVDAVLPGYEDNLPLPEPALVAAWWQHNRHRFQRGTRYLCGEAVCTKTANAVLARGKQRQRRAAAIELACLEGGAPFYEVRARGDRQAAQFENSLPHP